MTDRGPDRSDKTRLPPEVDAHLRDLNPWWQGLPGRVLPPFRRWLFATMLRRLPRTGCWLACCAAGVAQAPVASGVVRVEPPPASDVFPGLRAERLPPWRGTPRDNGEHGTDRGGDRTRGACFELGIGVQGNHGGETWVPGVTGLVAIDSGGHDLHARFDARVNYDFHAEAIDHDRHSLWSFGKLQFGALPILMASGETTTHRFGVRADVEYVDNTPTSIDRSLRGLLGPAWRIETPSTQTEILLGAHAANTDVDDELPRLQGIPRAELTSTRPVSRWPRASSTRSTAAGSSASPARC